RHKPYAIFHMKYGIRLHNRISALATLTLQFRNLALFVKLLHLTPLQLTTGGSQQCAHGDKRNPMDFHTNRLSNPCGDSPAQIIRFRGVAFSDYPQSLLEAVIDPESRHIPTFDAGEIASRQFYVLRVVVGAADDDQLFASPANKKLTARQVTEVACEQPSILPG